MKISKYNVEINEKGEGEVFAKVNGKTEMLGNIGNVLGLKHDAVEELVKAVLKANDIEIVDEKRQILDEQGIDLQFVRAKMRKVARDLTNDSIPVGDRKDLAEVYSDACVACKVIVDACKYEAALLELKEQYE